MTQNRRKAGRWLTSSWCHRACCPFSRHNSSGMWRTKYGDPTLERVFSHFPTGAGDKPCGKDGCPYTLAGKLLDTHRYSVKIGHTFENLYEGSFDGQPIFS